MENLQDNENVSSSSFQDNQNKDEEISLLDLVAVILHYKWMIVTVTGVAMVAAVIFSVISIMLPPEKSPLPNKFTQKAHMRIKKDSSSSSLATYLSTSDEYFAAVANKFNLTERYKIEKFPVTSTRNELSKTLLSYYDKASGVFTISFTDIDPTFAKDVVNFAVDWMQNRFDELGLDSNSIEKKNLEANVKATYAEILKLEKEAQRLGAAVNNGVSLWGGPNVSIETAMIQMELNTQQKVYEQLKTQYELLKVKVQSEQPVFQILERPEIPDMKSKPSLGKLCIIITFAAIFMSIFTAFALNAWHNIKNDPEAQKKLNLKPKKEK